jgi:DNA-3-methyladenine glycosylase II
MVHAEDKAADRWAEGRALLRAADPRMAALVDARPDLDPDAFFDTWPSELWSALVGQVIGQQISLAAALAIRGRLQALCGGTLPTPEQLLALDEATLRGVGLSRAKTLYLHDLAAQIKGVGRFTADGVLLLTLRRADIWPAADLALRRAVARVWEFKTAPSLVEVDAFGERFRPYRTLAAVYLLTARSPRTDSLSVTSPRAGAGGRSRATPAARGSRDHRRAR